MENLIRVHLVFYGRVQGVGFRFHSSHKATSLGLTGWVRNVEDGTVEMEAQGSPAALKELVNYIDTHPRFYLEKIDKDFIGIKKGEHGFSVTY